MQTQITSSIAKSAAVLVTPQFLLRVAGLPIDVADRLCFHKTVQWIESLQALESQLHHLRDQLVEGLHEAVQCHKEEREIRRALINFKRDVFNLRMPHEEHVSSLLLDAVLPHDRPLLQEWYRLWKDHRRELADGAQVFTQELIEKRGIFKETITLADFRKGILLASPVLDQAIDGYLLSDNVQLNREARTVERSLFEYLIRTACKTSPFSTFTTVSPGRFVQGPPQGRESIRYRVDDVCKISFPTINVALLSRFSALLIASPEIRSELPVCVTTGWVIKDERIMYLRRKQQADDLDEEMAIVIDRVQENVLYLPLSHFIRRLIALIGDGRTIKYKDLLTLLCQEPAYQHARASADEYLQHLLRLGFLLVPILQVDIHSQRPLATYRQRLAETLPVYLSEVDGALESIEGLLEQYATATPLARRQVVQEVRQQVKHMHAAIGVPEAPIPRTLIYEDTTISTKELAIEEENWKPIASDVAELQQLLPVFDVSLLRRMVTKAYFRARYGPGQRCDDFLTFANDFNRDFFDLYIQATHQPARPGEKDESAYENPLSQLNIEQMNQARQSVTAYITDRFKQLAPGASELVLDTDFLATVRGKMPRIDEKMRSNTFFSHVIQRDGEPRLVINRIYTGLTAMFSRFARHFSPERGYELVPSLRETLWQAQPAGAVFAELKGGYDATNLNLHPQVTDYELVCPGELSQRVAHEQIELSDLCIQDDPATDCLRLYSKRLGKEVIPLYLGFLLSVALPQIQQTLLNFSYLSMCPLELWQGVDGPESDESITFYPRLRYKHVILQRATWQMPMFAFPQRASGQSELHFFTEVARWRKKHGLPTRLFASTQAVRSEESTAWSKQEARIRKPLYIDFENYFSVALLESLVRGSTDRLMLTEMLPAHEQLWFTHAGQSYVSEIVFEMSRIGGPRE